ncbi:hypothetical protein AGR2A_pa40016 [Agrobacterium genomosp. 2 str. CFBP 5494]|uniref:Ada DNA repair metal-binding domain-containing protein n=1 Tax=Agrobacterium genomosp. 2 str. CFBP 5494 TaxID=1183436 RepID=A0A9W5F7L8_9HYPH|nr:hypothetical protein AGR2A_pa40016 [Agrobacterium genomosp. 2 str. CFBP 5494]
MLFDFPNLTHSTLLYWPEINVPMVKSSCVSLQLAFPARKAKRENRTFSPTIGECVEAGYRSCKRCHPLRRLPLLIRQCCSPACSRHAARPSLV